MQKRKMQSLSAYYELKIILQGWCVAKFSILPFSVFREKNSTLFWDIHIFMKIKGQKSENCNFFMLTQSEWVQTVGSSKYWWISTFCQVSGLIIKYFSFYGPKIPQKQPFWGSENGGKRLKRIHVLIHRAKSTWNFRTS